jgi:hypothetical protein
MTMPEMKRISVEIEVGNDWPNYDPNHHSVVVKIKRRPNGRWSVFVAEDQGGQDEFKSVVTGRGHSLDEAIDEAERRAQEVEMDVKYLTQALSRAADHAEDQMENECVDCGPLNAHEHEEEEGD